MKDARADEEHRDMASVANLGNLLVRRLHEGIRGECYAHLRGWDGRMVAWRKYGRQDLLNDTLITRLFCSPLGSHPFA